MDVRQYRTASGRCPFDDWLSGLRDGVARARIVAQVHRLSIGLRGD